VKLLKKLNGVQEAEDAAFARTLGERDGDGDGGAGDGDGGRPAMDSMDINHDKGHIVIDDDPTLQMQVQIHTYIQSHTRNSAHSIHT
jgi:hypothetical protein